jgi:hypothetical protein
MNDLNQRLREERSTADSNAARLEPAQQSRWEACKSSHRFQAFQGKQVVAYRLMFLIPEISDILTCTGLEVSLAGGLASFWKSRNTEQVFRVSDIPTEVTQNCFFWMLKYSNLEMVYHKGQKSLRFPLAYKTELNPAVRVDGPIYLLEKSVFDHTKFNEVEIDV